MNLDEINAQIDAIKIQTEENAKVEKELTEAILKIRREYDQKIAGLQENRLALKREIATKQHELKELQHEKQSVEARTRRERELALLNDRLDEISEELDNLTDNAVWRAFAFDHQIYAGKRLAFSHGLVLADEMGLGKTGSAILGLDLIRARSRNASVANPIKPPFEATGLPEVVAPAGNRVLYLCPKALINNVKREFAKWAPERMVFPITGKLAQRDTRDMMFTEMLPRYNNYVVVLNYEAWRKDKSLVDKLIDLHFDTVIIDEAHNLKNTETQAFRYAYRIIRGSKLDEQSSRIMPGSPIPYRLVMTGTPILNRPDDIFTALHIVSPGQFIRRSDFLYSYCQQRWSSNGRMYWAFRPGGEKALMRKIESYIIKRKKGDVGINLPPMTIERHDLEIDLVNYPEQYRVYNEMKDFGAALIDQNSVSKGFVQANVVIAMLLRLRQMLLWPAGINITDPISGEIRKFDVQESQKLDYLIKDADTDNELQAEGFITEITRHRGANPDGERTVVFSQFVAPLYELERRLRKHGYEVALLVGDSKHEYRDMVAKDFDKNYVDEKGTHYDIVLCNYKVGGVGLNFTDATQAIILDKEWNIGKRDQAYQRLHRIGQDKPVTINEINIEKTVDDWMQGLLEVKQEMLEGFEGELDLASRFMEAIQEGTI